MTRARAAMTAEELARFERAAREADHARCEAAARALNDEARGYVERQGIVSPSAGRRERARACAAHVTGAVHAPAQIPLAPAPRDALPPELQDYVTRAGIAFGYVTRKWVAAGVHSRDEVEQWRKIIDADIAGAASVNPAIDPRPRAERVKAWWATWSRLAQDMQNGCSK